jgi:hypothetical protein
MNILTVNLILSTLVFWLAARLYVVPRLSLLDARSVLVPILLLHSLRHLGLMFLAPSAVEPGMPAQFAYPAAFGDLVAALLAFTALVQLLRGARSTVLLLWIFNIVGTVDLMTAITLAIAYDAPLHMGAAYWIPAFWVPALLVTHYLVFVVLHNRAWSSTWSTEPTSCSATSTACAGSTKARTRH